MDATNFYAMLMGADIGLRIKFPGELDARQFRVTVGGSLAEGMRPLPADRELPWCLDSQRMTAEMIAKRREVARWVSQQLTEAMLEAFKVNDPVNGYPPVEQLPPLP